MKKIITYSITAAFRLCSLLSCANANKTAEFAPEKEVPVSADVHGVPADTINNPDAEPIQP